MMSLVIENMDNLSIKEKIYMLVNSSLFSLEVRTYIHINENKWMEAINNNETYRKMLQDATIRKQQLFTNSIDLVSQDKYNALLNTHADTFPDIQSTAKMLSYFVKTLYDANHESKREITLFILLDLFMYKLDAFEISMKINNRDIRKAKLLKDCITNLAVLNGTQQTDIIYVLFLIKLLEGEHDIPCAKSDWLDMFPIYAYANLSNRNVDDILNEVLPLKNDESFLAKINEINDDSFKAIKNMSDSEYDDISKCMVLSGKRNGITVSHEMELFIKDLTSELLSSLMDKKCNWNFTIPESNIGGLLSCNDDTEVGKICTDDDRIFTLLKHKDSIYVLFYDPDDSHTIYGILCDYTNPNTFKCIEMKFPENIEYRLK